MTISSSNSVGSVFSLDTDQISFFTKRLRSQDKERPENLWGCSSTTGFLAADEDLLICCEADRKVLEEKKVTYLTIAQRLASLVNEAASKGLYGIEAREGRIIDKKFKVQIEEPTFCAQFCPFTLSSDHNASPFESIANACSKSNLDITITNLINGRSIKFSSLLSHLIYKHHFFEGRVPHRLDPSDIIETLEILPDPNFTSPF